MSELKTIFVEGREFDLLGSNVTVKTICVGDLPAMLSVVDKVLALLPKLKTDKDRNSAILNAIKEDFDAIITLLEITTDLKKETITKLNIAALSILIAEVVKENADFLSQHVVTNLNFLFQSYQAKENSKSQSGSTKSKS